MHPFLFAATEAGPYVFVAAANQWYPLISNSMPIQYYSSVEYLTASNTVRFGTMGRGIWDFRISSILPVSLLQFTATKQQDKALLNWNTTTESNSSHFVIERSLDGHQYVPVGKVTAAGNSNVNRNYHFADDLAVISRQGTMVYYRLQMVDKNGAAVTSRIVSIKMAGNAHVLTLLSNPVHSEAVLQYETTAAQKINILLTDASGKIVMRKNMEATAGQGQYRLSVAALAKGIYTITLIADGEKQWIRMLKE